jgi:hypothetical protein
MIFKIKNYIKKLFDTIIQGFCIMGECYPIFFSFNSCTRFINIGYPSTTVEKHVD